MISQLRAAYNSIGGINMALKGSAKIQLFNAKTGKLERTVESSNIITNDDLYKLFDDLGVAYKKDNVIRYKGKLYDNKLKEIS